MGAREALYRAGLSLKAAARRLAAPWSSWGGIGWGRPWLGLGTLPGSRFDYEREAGEVTHCGPVGIALGWIGDNFPEPRLQVVAEGDGGQAEPVKSHPLAQLVASPNPLYDGDALLGATAMAYSAYGNAYWYKARPRSGGPPLELWYVPTGQIRPRARREGEYPSYYEYRAGGERFDLAWEDVVHFRFGISEDLALGVNRLYPVLREICTDNALSTLLAALCRNRGVVDVALVPKEKDAYISEEQAKILQTEWGQRYGGENAGKPFVATGAVEVVRLGLSPADLDLEKLRAAPESRICAALRLSPLVLGLNSGDRTKTFSNYGQARRQSYEDCLVPMHRRFARAMERQLLAEWEPAGSGLEVGWDYSKVAALRETLTELYRQNTLAVMGGWMTPNMALRRAGFAPLPDAEADRLRPQQTTTGGAMQSPQQGP